MFLLILQVCVKGKVYESTEKYSVLRALKAIERSNVVLVVIDAEQGIIEQDKRVAGYAHEEGKAIVIVVNKWDTVEKDSKTMKSSLKMLEMNFNSWIMLKLHLYQLKRAYV